MKIVYEIKLVGLFCLQESEGISEQLKSDVSTSEAVIVENSTKITISIDDFEVEEIADLQNISNKSFDNDESDNSTTTLLVNILNVEILLCNNIIYFICQDEILKNITRVTDQWKANRRQFNKTFETEDEYERVDSSEDKASDDELQGESNKQYNEDNESLASDVKLTKTLVSKEKYLKTPVDYADQVLVYCFVIYLRRYILIFSIYLFFYYLLEKQLDDNPKVDKSQRWKLDPMFLGSMQNASQSIAEPEWSSNSTFIEEIRRQSDVALANDTTRTNSTQINFDNIASIEIQDVQ